MLEINHIMFNIGDYVSISPDVFGTLVGWNTSKATVELDNGDTVKVGFFLLSHAVKPATVASHLVAAILGKDHEFRIHAADCVDVPKEAKKYRDDPWVFAASSRHEVNMACWGDIATDHHEDDSPEWHALCDEYAQMETTYLPCCPITE